ncbi:MAG TPA: helix-turn-helix domain-containing protein [Coxiellaceae bacterium]|nr:MAG: transcriptional regulator [Gammaproteobacteria bacterium RIFCSPHIGHO2_12_FULL_36_30]HLB55831.1 helix-turn-helix domain-containing protein [Coxiellaceae bacterium]
MRTKGKKKRNLFNELAEGIAEIKAHKKGKITLRHFSAEKKSRPKVSARIIRDTREKFHMSRNIFALILRVSPRTLEKWEQGETIPNDQAAVLILMVRKYPDTLKRLNEV